MQTEKVMRFDTIEQLRSALENYLEYLKKTKEEHSKLIGEKLRTEEADNSSELAELKAKLQGSDDPKKKKSIKKKDRKTNWLEFDAISVYNGIGIKGELELYFKSLDELKSKIDKIQKTKEAVEHLVSRGVRKDLGCAALMTQNVPFEMAFIKSAQPRRKFAYKSIYNVGIEEIV